MFTGEDQYGHRAFQKDAELRQQKQRLGADAV